MLSSVSNVPIKRAYLARGFTKFSSHRTFVKASGAQETPHDLASSSVNLIRASRQAAHIDMLYYVATQCFM